MMVFAQPEHQLAFEALAVFDAELRATVRPPFVKAAVANHFARIEESAGIGTAKKLLAPGAGNDAQQTLGVLQSIEVDFVACYDLLCA